MDEHSTIAIPIDVYSHSSRPTGEAALGGTLRPGRASEVSKKSLQNKNVAQSWERTDLVVRTVFKIAEVVARRLVGSIPTRSRQNRGSTRTNSD